jgi:hypothetical protein
MTAMKRRVTRAEIQRDPSAVWNAYLDLIAVLKALCSDGRDSAGRASVFRYESEVQNGDHLQSFENEPADLIAPTLASLRIIGVDVYAPILSEAINRRWSKDGKTLENIEDYVAEALEGEFDDPDEVYYNAQPPMIKLLENYLNQWQVEFVVERYLAQTSEHG